MSNDPSVRRLLPQNAQVGSFSFAPQQQQQQQQYQQPRETQKNYVFVDEHNRHKRLKVMRACEGCRRRKIKCDAATTNTWPCSACIRLKLHCVRPNGFDGAADSGVYEPSGSGFETSASAQDPYGQQLPIQPQQQPQQMLAGPSKPGPSMYAPQASYTDSGMYPPVQYSDPQAAAHGLNYTTIPASQMGTVDHSYPPQPVFPTPPHQHGSHADSPPDSYAQDQYGQQDLADLLGSLKVNEAGTAPYLNSKMRGKAQAEEEPALEDSDEYKSPLPPMMSGPGLKIRIPPELMPDDETILHYFDLFFAHVHPYVPVLDRSTFYQQWQKNRDSVSPLIIEAIFAIAGRLADDPAQGQQWLALATRHADSFMDVPRLSTLQALLIILKAREASPKRGYYYRSWMSIVQCVQMGKDLGLDEHYFDHKAGRSCGFNPSECLLRTRIWQTVFVCEVMIGSPQGRTDLAVEIDSVDLGVPRPLVNGDESEYHVSRNFTYFARAVRNVARLNQVYARVKRNKDWGVDPELVQLNPAFHSWLSELPADLIINFPQDGSPPWLPSHFIGNMHSYHYLSLILLNRPQLTFLEPTSVDGQWKQHMMICYTSAKLLCRLQEAVLQSYGLTALQSMQRGVNFTIYCVLTCIVLHLVALTSPDPDLNADAREYFTRHMRILERCMTAWPMPDMQRQIDAVREAFSADTRKPFVLKPSFPYGSPHPAGQPSPSRGNPGFRPGMPRTGSMEQQTIDTQAAVQHSQSLVMMQGTQAPAMQQTIPLADAPGWNPSRIFDQWNTSFGTMEVPTLSDIQAVHTSLPQAAQQAMPPPQQYSAAPVQSFVTPAMWQESVASVYEGGLKRAWDYDSSNVSMTRRR
ncbi:Lipase regulator 1 [Pleurostoma richardsiae]|uniref:Lipase regulator 1 n=1 Tax=Pleurostoma richardsiae TaxID=41990 RepID=A0AA38R1X5_9PEZI|nr:Lipase regulator 1 [Pleurostoma richardsiae]